MGVDKGDNGASVFDSTFSRREKLRESDRDHEIYCDKAGPNCPLPYHKPPARSPSSYFTSAGIGNFLQIAAMLVAMLVWALQIRNDATQLRAEVSDARTTIADLRTEVQALKLEQARTTLQIQFLVEREKLREDRESSITIRGRERGRE